jgi:hypothetical protein
VSEVLRYEDGEIKIGHEFLPYRSILSTECGRRLPQDSGTLGHSIVPARSSSTASKCPPMYPSGQTLAACLDICAAEYRHDWPYACRKAHADILKLTSLSDMNEAQHTEGIAHLHQAPCLRFMP